MSAVNFHPHVRARRRDLWAYLTKHGRLATYTAIMRDMGYKSHETLSRDMRVLKMLGYISSERYKTGTTRVLIPFLELP